MTAREIANYFLTLQDEDGGDISNLKLQKLLYYAQGLHLASYGMPLFSEGIYAWQHGPVVPDIYQEFKQFGSGAIPRPKDFDDAIYQDEVKEFLNEVYEVFGQFSAWKLRNMTHEEAPYKEVASWQGKIRHEAMREHFEQYVKDSDD
jgi:uncharacterized phage-associated protein